MRGGGCHFIDLLPMERLQLRVAKELRLQGYGISNHCWRAFVAADDPPNSIIAAAATGAVTAAAAAAAATCAAQSAAAYPTEPATSESCSIPPEVTIVAEPP
mmetsp:Transcript_21209/g.37909  ORF Transcript_21209/g.37909 Transcript_21209/m.37909 type:complete len:102 (-) Transcript_21209:91-396(-)